MKRLVMVFLLSVLVVGCQDQRTVTAPPGELLALISDGAHAGGNPDFFFLPPLVGNPSSNVNFEAGQFNPGLRPVVDVYPLPAGPLPIGGTDGCTFTGSPISLGVAPVEGMSEHYKINWNTRVSNLVPGTTYRICVFRSSAGTLLGFLDVAPIAGGMKNARTSETYAFQDDRTLPIKFRIEGGLCAGRLDCGEFTTVGVAEGGPVVDFVLPSGFAALSIPAGAIPVGEEITIAIEKQAPLYDGECLPTGYGLEQSTGCYRFRTNNPGEDGTYHFLKDVRMEVCVEAGDLDPEALRVWKYDSDGESGPEELQWAEPTLIDCTGFVALNADGSHAPASFASTLWRGAGRLFANLVGPRPLYAATMFATPKGLGGLAGSFSDVGGAVSGEEGLLPDLTFGEYAPSITGPTSPSITVDVNVQNIGEGSAGNFQVSLELWHQGVDDLYEYVRSYPSANQTLGPSGNVIVTFTIPCSDLPWGQYYIKAEADVGDAVEETDETNNTSPEKYFVSGSGVCGS